MARAKQTSRNSTKPAAKVVKPAPVEDDATESMHSEENVSQDEAVVAPAAKATPPKTSALDKITHMTGDAWVRWTCAQLAAKGDGLKKNMSADQLIELVGWRGPSDEVEDEEPIVIDKKSLPTGLSVERAKNIIRTARKGIPSGNYLHVVTGKIVKPTQNHEAFYRNEKSRIFGPMKKENKGKAEIDWLAKQIGKVSDPPEPVVEAALPSNWKANKVITLLDKVTRCNEDKMISFLTSREVDYNEDKMVCNEKYKLCAAKKDKLKFLALVAYLDGLDEWQDIEFTPGLVKEKKTSGGKGGKGKGSKGKAAAAKDDDDDEEETKPTRGKATQTKVKAAAAQNDDDDGTASADEDDEKEIDYEKLKKKLDKAKEGEYIDVYTLKGVKRTEDNEETHEFNDLQFCVKKEKSSRATKVLVNTIVNKLTELEGSE